MKPGTQAAGVLLALLMAGCTPLGLARGDYWTGTSTGDRGACPAFEFEIALADRAISGTATSQFEWGKPEPGCPPRTARLQRR